MVDSGEKVIVALSGGLDSSVAAALLIESGYDCQGVFIITSEANRHAQPEAEDVAHRLGIELAVLDLRDQFEHILDYFVGEYARARTPNPCVVCNRLVKFGTLRRYARRVGAKSLATGHYARVAASNDDVGLYEAADWSKDQSYVLAMIERRVLSEVLLPMGGYSKDRTRQMAHDRGLGTESRAESQEICFIPDDDYVVVLESRSPELVREGPIVDGKGQPLGVHNGIHRYTIGQRRGLGVAMGKPYYVTHLDAAKNTVVLGPKAEVMHRCLVATDVNWLMDPPQGPFGATVKIRYNDRGKPAAVLPCDGYVQVEFDEPNAAITPGQLAVFYVEQDGMRRVAGAGWIDRPSDRLA